VANKEHLARLKQEVEEWNQWRGEHPEIYPDLTGAYLRRADLHEADLHGANLDEAHLYDSDLRDANLRGATLRSAHLRGANLDEARLDGANLDGASLLLAYLQGANLDGASLRSAYLQGANLRWANLHGADFTKASIGWTNFADVDLSMARGLETVQPEGPSTIGIDTLSRSHGNIPEVFLRGAGVPEEMITYSKSLVGRPFYSCFISYSSRDDALAQRLYADLQNKGVRCWFAPEDLKIGDEFRSRIDESIQVYDRLLLILSEYSVKSRWVQKEVETAFEKEGKEDRVVLFPVRIDEAVMHSAVDWAADIRRQRHIGDFRQWKDHNAYQKAFNRLLRDLKADI
jgi:hypothetical protein